MKPLSLVPVAVVGLLLTPAGAGSDRIWSNFETPRGYALRIPQGWRASVRPAGGVTVITSVPVPNRNDNPERVKLPPAGAYLWIFDYGRIRGNFPTRPSRIDLGKQKVHSCGFGEGYMLNFRDHGHLLQVFVRLEPRADRGTVLAVVNSLRVTK